MRTSASATVPTPTGPVVWRRTAFMSCIQRGWPSMSATASQTRSIGASMTTIDLIGSGSSPADCSASTRSMRVADAGAGQRESERAADHRITVAMIADAGGLEHLGQRAVAVALFEVDRGDGVGQHLGPIAELDRVERGRLDAVVGREADDDDALDAGVAQEPVELGRRSSRRSPDRAS